MGGGRWQGRSQGERVDPDELPALVYVPELACFLGRSENAVRHAVRRGLLPAPVNAAGRLAWRAVDVRKWLAEIRGVENGRPQMHITATPYNYQGRNAPAASRYQVTFRLPTPEKELRARCVAPAGLDHAGALAWARGLQREIYAELLGAEPKEQAPLAKPTRTALAQPTREESAPSTVPTLAAFFVRFETEYLHTCKPATVDSYRSIWRNHLEPILGATPMDLIDRAALAKLRKALGGVAPSSRNMMLSKLRAILEMAETWQVLSEDQVPKIKAEKVLQQEVPIVYTDEQIAAMLTAARADLGSEDRRELAAIILLATHAALRVSEICALRWSDVDLERKLIHVRHNFSRGRPATPKGGKEAPVGITNELMDVLRALPRRGIHVLVHHWRGKDRPHTPHTITGRLNKLQDACGLPRSGPHLFRHSGLTGAARRGASPWDVQAQARHRRISTTMRYIHLAAENAARGVRERVGRRARQKAARRTRTDPCISRLPRQPTSKAKCARLQGLNRS
jgi:integrase